MVKGISDPRYLRFAATALLVVALYYCCSAVYIHAKAELAQLLLQRAWSATQLGESRVRPWPWADTWPVARLEAPRLGVDLIVLNGISGASLAFAPGLISDGNAVEGSALLAGHRDTHFRFLAELRQHDLIVLHTHTGQQQRYRVETTRVVDSSTSTVLLDPTQARLILATCYPFDAVDPGGALRYVVYARALTRHISSQRDPIASTLHPQAAHPAPL